MPMLNNKKESYVKPIPSELKMGKKVEKEHTTRTEIAKRIALDHLAEIPDYYTRLHKMEADAKREMKMRKMSALDQGFFDKLADIKNKEEDDSTDAGGRKLDKDDDEKEPKTKSEKARKGMGKLKELIEKKKSNKKDGDDDDEDEKKEMSKKSSFEQGFLDKIASGSGNYEAAERGNKMPYARPSKVPTTNIFTGKESLRDRYARRAKARAASPTGKLKPTLSSDYTKSKSIGYSGALSSSPKKINLSSMKKQGFLDKMADFGSWAQSKMQRATGMSIINKGLSTKPAPAAKPTAKPMSSPKPMKPAPMINQFSPSNNRRASHIASNPSIGQGTAKLGPRFTQAKSRYPGGFSGRRASGF